ncbi:aldose reductase [Dimargaris cristalligena]|uniref:Aldose reductase n=1 Tax=Dimargaris cristalligena TaxID=215637 RepID=A0A4P9ZRS9_9FUNG|nr:aldose reductase [Dimargaris cristalligena]|eukprot:RKP35160.1 aldose reductase [Dimargaris cristalligena]
MPNSKTIQLHSGARMPAIGLGTWNAQPGEMDFIVREAWNLGYRHIDCAHLYENEKKIGNALRQANVPRDQLWLTSKLWNTDHRPDDVGPACQTTLDHLGCDYLDLYLMHWPLAFVHGEGLKPFGPDGHMKMDTGVTILETWRAMEKLVDAGLVRNIGVSNFTITQLTDLLQNARIKPAVNQIECNPYIPQHHLVDFCHQHSIAVTAYRPLGGRSRDDRPPQPLVREDPIVNQVAQRINKSPAQVILAWLLKRNISVIPKSSNPARLAENLVDFELSDEDASEISKINVLLVRPFLDTASDGR